ncbi:MAG: dihydroorotate dehydrogenase (quinone) [Candidatus Woykebacteria bacterium RBG_13_40_7b]|uniref:Dihydroorotate dehydrogenase (quinone) n=1 Tax=Candidatus Woykebacteria bacterium RBG_13_40_7b TaxID=1802594 RepID=A0A1G1WB50_9BACT|nr:MAG: dihydroorotate dehydrogenase (quinone) [Candidatus Woykebacteria bacterium RBG_13_40_7b]
MKQNLEDFRVYIRNALSRFVYKAIVRPIFFRIEAETIHNFMVKFGNFLGGNSLTRNITHFHFSYSNKILEQNILGIRFSNPIGLAAGFDKDGHLTQILPAVGFGFAEVGSITGEPCLGNPRPRLWRLVKSKGIVVYYGLKNEGCEKISNRLKNCRFAIPIGTSIAKTNSPKTVAVETGIADYVKAYKKFTNIGEFSTINISCPNAYGGQPFTDAQRLDRLLTEIEKVPTKKPVFLKMPPDLDKEKVDRIIEVARRHKVAGFICTNLTDNRNNKRIVDHDINKEGGISGKPVEELANDSVKYVYQKTKGDFVIVGCGGVFSAEDAYKKIKLGASLVQLITGMIFEGPQLISEINYGLVKLLRKDGFTNISEAIGIENN